MDQAYIAQPGSRAYDENCTPVAELNFKRFPALEADGSFSMDKDRLWTMACAYADADSEEEGDDVAIEARQDSSDQSDEESDSGSDSDDETELTAEQFMEICDGAVNIGAHLPFALASAEATSKCANLI